MKTEIKPCPFCGGEAHVYQTLGEKWACGCNLLVGSDKCGISAIRMIRNDAVEAWNRRVMEKTGND